MTRLLDCYFADYIETEVRKVTQDDVEDLESSLEQLFVFAVTWTVGATTNLEGREKFHNKFSKMLADKVGFPSQTKIYDVMWDKGKKEWMKWTDTVDEYFVDSK